VFLSPITSSLIQAVSKISRAICAVVAASSTVLQPAVLCSTRSPSSRMMRQNSWPSRNYADPPAEPEIGRARHRPERECSRPARYPSILATGSSRRSRSFELSAATVPDNQSRSLGINRRRLFNRPRHMALEVTETSSDDSNFWQPAVRSGPRPSPAFDGHVSLVDVSPELPKRSESRREKAYMLTSTNACVQIMSQKIKRVVLIAGRPIARGPRRPGEEKKCLCGRWR